MEFKNIFMLSQKKLKNALKKELTREYPVGSVIAKDGFLYAEGTLPILYIAHLDTVHKNAVRDICISETGIMMSPQGIGGDDRCGVHIILEILKSLDERPHILFTEDEEIGGIGASKFCNAHINPNVNFIVEFDRQGNNDAVFYDCDNEDFVNFVEGFELKEDYGSFSDISIIAPHLKIAAVNVSCCYFNAHSLHEYVDLNALPRIINIGVQMAEASLKLEKQFEYIPMTKKFSNGYKDWFKGYGTMRDFGFDNGYDEDDFFYGEESVFQIEQDYYLIDSSGKYHEPISHANGFMDIESRFCLACEDFDNDFDIDDGFYRFQYTVVDENGQTIEPDYWAEIPASQIVDVGAKLDKPIKFA